MSEIISCCGVVCSACQYYPTDCAGCPAIEGKAFWLQYTGGNVCEIYQCCVEEKGLAHCGLCPELPCARYEAGDPTRSEEENEAIQREQLAQLRRLAQEG